MNYIDPQIVPDQRKELVLNGRELLFLTRGDAYAPIQDQNPDVELHVWALWRAKDRLSSPSRALVDAMLARWPKQIGPVYGSWNAAGLIANVLDLACRAHGSVLRQNPDDVH